MDLKVQRRSIFVLSGIDLTKRWTHLLAALVREEAAALNTGTGEALAAL